jgi:hypothetical protein
LIAEISAIIMTQGNVLNTPFFREISTSCQDFWTQTPGSRFARCPGHQPQGTPGDVLAPPRTGGSFGIFRFFFAAARVFLDHLAGRDYRRRCVNLRRINRQVPFEIGVSGFSWRKLPAYVPLCRKPEPHFPFFWKDAEPSRRDRTVPP